MTCYPRRRAGPGPVAAAAGGSGTLINLVGELEPWPDVVTVTVTGSVPRTAAAIVTVGPGRAIPRAAGVSAASVTPKSQAQLAWQPQPLMMIES